MSDSLAPDVLKPLLRGRFGHVHRYAESTDSTQRMLAEDAAEGAIAVAEVQTEGRGRLGRAWEAPAGTSVLVSVLLLPAVEAPRLPELSLVAGGAVAQAIAEVTGLEPAIKFPNDILVHSRKVAGILAESSEGRVVLGIGVNVNQTLEQLPTDAKTEPTSLRLELGGPVSRARLLAAILLQLELAYDAWVMGTSRSG
ncbi:MAG: biotin--[acetyl-CoA-carboxylase] ligase [Gaiellaceae bacterium]